MYRRDFFTCDTVKRRLRNIDEVIFHESWHMAIEECQKKCTNMGAIDIGIGHDDDFMIPKLFKIEIVLPNPAPKSSDHRADFLVLQNFFKTAFSTFKILPRIGRIA